MLEYYAVINASAGTDFLTKNLNNMLFCIYFMQRIKKSKSGEASALSFIALNEYLIIAI